MKRYLPFTIFAVAILCSANLATAVDFREEVRPILNEKCFKCHSGPRAKGKLRMDEDDYFVKRIGGEDPVIVPGDSAQSLLAIKAGLPRSDGDAMPPPPARARGAEPMTAAELNLVKQWIAEGANLEPGEPTPTTSDTSGEESPAMSDQLHTWTNTAGNSLEAAFVSLEGANVKLRKSDGSEFSYPVANLDANSQALARKLAEE
ncbi:MAG: c-type cytochrome domain-containing protein [Verrucomicrobiales bacterium]